MFCTAAYYIHMKMDRIKKLSVVIAAWTIFSSPTPARNYFGFRSLADTSSNPHCAVTFFDASEMAQNLEWKNIFSLQSLSFKFILILGNYMMCWCQWILFQKLVSLSQFSFPNFGASCDGITALLGHRADFSLGSEAQWFLFLSHSEQDWLYKPMRKYTM